VETSDYILLRYARSPELVNNEHPLSGTILTSVAGLVLETSFNGLSFLRMMISLSTAIAAHPELRVFMSRLEQTEKFALELDRDTTNLIRTDPIAATRALSEPHRRVLVRGSTLRDTQPPAVLMPEPLRAGYDTLADAFGEDVYIRTRLKPDGDGSVLLLESPFHGRWSMPYSTDGTLFLDIKRLVPIELTGAETRWATVRVEHLLRHTTPRFWLPRAWNPGSWIFRADLETRLKKFRSESS
jgi:hypothetical protein